MRACVGGGTHVIYTQGENLEGHRRRGNFSAGLTTIVARHQHVCYPHFKVQIV